MKSKQKKTVERAIVDEGASRQNPHRKDASKGTPKPHERRRPLTLSEIRAIQRNAPEDSMADKRLGDSFTLEGADDAEKAFLTVCRAVYGRSQDALSEDNVPAEKLICSLLFQISYWPLTLEDVKDALEDNEGSWKQREEAAQLVREEMEEKRTLLKQCGETRVGCEGPENEPSQRIQ